MLSSILKQQLSELLGNISVFYASTNILNNLKNQINNLSGKVSQELIDLYNKDYNMLISENKKLDDDINDIINNSSKISDIINELGNFNISTTYLQTVIDTDYGFLQKYASLIPDVIKRLNIFNENLETLQLAILNQTGQYSLISPMSTQTKVVIGVGVITLIGILLYKKYA